MSLLGALTGRLKITGDILGTGVPWDGIVLVLAASFTHACVENSGGDGGDCRQAAYACAPGFVCAERSPEWYQCEAQGSGDAGSDADRGDGVVGDAGDPGETANVLPSDRVVDAAPDAGAVDAGPDALVGDGGFAPRAAYRFDCINIKQLGPPPSAARERPIQADTLNQKWREDIELFRLNVLVVMGDPDPNTGKVPIRIGSGVGSGFADLCVEATTDRPPLPSDVALGTSMYAVTPQANAGEPCAAEDAAAPAYGTARFEVHDDDRVYIYAENNQGLPYNCTADERPNAVPLREVRADLTLSPDGKRLAGRMVACLTKSDLETLCSCISPRCHDMAADDLQSGGVCDGCARSGTTLGALFGAVQTSPECDPLVGEPAYQMVVGFSAKRLDGRPPVCQ